MKFFNKKNSVDNTSMKKGVRLITVADPKSVNTEQFNTIRTNIEFSGVDKQYKSLMVTSSVMSEGKSTISANLAVAFAKQGKRVILVDSDLRRPTMNATFSISRPTGITNFLTDSNIKLSDIIYRTSVDNLCIIPSGPIPPNPSELIGSNKMTKLITTLSEKSDLVIYDAPPVLSVTDAQIISTKVDGTILVVKANSTEKSQVKMSVNLIDRVHGHIVGSILNDVMKSANGYYGYYANND